MAIETTEDPYPQVVAWFSLEETPGARLRVRWGHEAESWTLDAMKVIVP